MSALEALAVRRASLLETLRRSLVEAEENGPREYASAQNIQRVYRGLRARNRVRNKHVNANAVQRVFRGHMGRQRSRGELRSKNERRMLSLFTFFAIQIQRSFRGHYSRKYKANHADRKRFIATVQESGRQVREMMYQYSMEQAMREEHDALEKREKEFRETATGLHHLVSTHQIRGVFNPPTQYLEKPTWQDVPVEDHVRGVIRDLLRTRGIPKSGLVPDMHGSRRIPLKGLKTRLSVQASAPYESLDKEKSRKLALHKILTADKGSWFAGGKVRLLDQSAPPLNASEPYIDANLNPLLKRGVPRDQKQLLESARSQKALFDPPLERPFYQRSGGNKSSVMPNDVFDVIGDAEETGGVTQRKYGTTSRFGVPESCDARPPGGVLPAPPARASTLRTSRPRVNTYQIKVRPGTGGGGAGGLPVAAQQTGWQGQGGGGYADDDARRQADPYWSSDDEQ